MLLVAYHVVGSSADRGLALPPESAWHYAMTSFELIRMPIFTILSGLLYGVHRATQDKIKDFSAKKIRRIGVPLLVLTLLTWTAREAFGFPHTELITALTDSYEHFWFLQALLLIFAVVALIDVAWRPGFVQLLFMSFAAALFSATTHVSGPFSIDRAVYLLPFFLFGLAMSQAPVRYLNIRSGLIFLTTALVVLMFQQLGMAGLGAQISRTSIMGFAGGCCAAMALLALMPRLGWLAMVGQYSYTIYLWHVMFLSAARRGLRGMGVDDIPVLFVASLLSGLILPIVLHRVAVRHHWLSIALLGIRPSSRTAIRQEVMPAGSR